MSDFNNAIANDSDAFLETFYETVTYKPFNGTPRSIKAIVTRNIDTASQAPRVRMKFSMQVKNNGTTGILVEDIDFGRDRVTVAKYDGSTITEDRAISPNISNQDAGMIYLDLV